MSGWTSFGVARSLAQQPRTVARDLALCGVLRDTPRAILRDHGMLDYLLMTLLEGDELLTYRRHPGRAVRALRRGEVFGDARQAVVDLRGYKRPTNRMLDVLCAQNAASPVAHLLLDHTACGADWLLRLLGLGDWSGLRWLSLQGCALEGGVTPCVEALSGQVVGLVLADNALNNDDMRGVAGWAGLGAVRWLDVRRAQADAESWKIFVRGAQEREVSWLGLDVSEAPGFDDEVLGEALDRELCTWLMTFRCHESGVSEYGLPALLWSSPPEQLEMLSFGDTTSGRTSYLDQEAILGLLQVPAMATLHEFEWTFSDVESRSSDMLAMRDTHMLEALIEQPWLATLEVCGLHAFSLAALAAVDVFALMPQLDALRLTKLWCTYDATHIHLKTRAKISPSQLIDEFYSSIRPMGLHELQLGFLQDEYATWQNSWDGWNDQVRDRLIHDLCEVIDLGSIKEFAWDGEQGLGEWLEGTQHSTCFSPARCVFRCSTSQTFQLVHMLHVLWLRRVPCVQTQESWWSGNAVSHGKSLGVHPRMRHAFSESVAHDVFEPTE